MARERVTAARALCMRGYLLTVSLSAWMDGAHGIGDQLIPQYPVVSQSVTLSVTGVTGTVIAFAWYKGSSADTNNQIFIVIPPLNSVTKGPQYFPRANWFPNGSLQISGLVPTDQGSYTVLIETAGSRAQHTVSLPVYDYDESYSDNSAAITVAIICGSILGIVLISGIMALLYRKYVLPLRGQSGDRGEDPSQIYYNIPNTAAAHPTIEEGPYMGLQYPSQDTYSELKR